MKELGFVMLLCFGVLGVVLWNEFYEHWWKVFLLIPLAIWGLWVYWRTDRTK